MTTKKERLAFEPTPGGPKCVVCGKKSYFASRGVFYCQPMAPCTPAEAREPAVIVAARLDGR